MAFLFFVQESLSAGMMQDLYQASPVTWNAFEMARLGNALSKYIGKMLENVRIFNVDFVKTLNKTKNNL